MRTEKSLARDSSVRTSLMVSVLPAAPDVSPSSANAAVSRAKKVASAASSRPKSVLVSGHPVLHLYL